MKYILIGLLFLSKIAFTQKSIYNINIQTQDSVDVKLSDFKGMKLLIASVTPEKLQSGTLNYLDSLQLSNLSIKIFVIPADDLGGTNNKEILKGIKEENKQKVTICSSSKVIKDDRVSQNKLMNWLTTADDNLHFDMDVTEEVQMYVINESGQVYAVIKNRADDKVMSEILNQKDLSSN